MTTTYPPSTHERALVDRLTGQGGDGHAALTLRGDLDVASAPRLTALLEPRISAGGPVVLVDASAVTFIDSSGLQPLLDAAARLRVRGAQLRLVNASPAVRRVAAVLGSCGVLGLAPAGPPPAPTCA